MIPHELGIVPKAMEVVLKGTQALRSAGGAVVHGAVGSGLNGVLMKHIQPGLLQVFSHSFHGCLESSTALRGRGIPSFIPTFDGVSNRAFVTWLHKVECFFGDACYSESMKCDMVLSCLKGVALLWYNGLKLSRLINGKDEIKTWCKLTHHMKMKFLPNLNDLLTELKTLKQNSLSVSEYANVFEELHFVCDANVEYVQKGVRFFYGLRSEISEPIDLEMKYPFDEMLKLALCVEERLASTRKVENLLHKQTSGCVGAVVDEMSVNQVLNESCVEAMVGKYECIEYDVLTQPRECLNDEMGVLGTVTVQGIVLDPKLSNEADFEAIGRLDSCLGSQNTEEHAYGDVNDPLFELKSTAKGLVVNGVKIGAELDVYVAQLGAFDSEFPWECWSPNEVIRVSIGHEASNGRSRIGLMLYKGCCRLVFWCQVSYVAVIRPRHFILIYDPGGIDDVPSLEVAFEQMSLNFLNSFKKMHFKVIRISLFSIMSWCGLWSIAKFEVKFLLNQGCLKQELRYGYVIFQSIESKMPLTTQETNPQSKEHQNWTFCFDSRIMVMLFAPYLEFNLVKICVLYMVQFMKISSFKWLWNHTHNYYGLGIGTT